MERPNRKDFDFNDSFEALKYIKALDAYTDSISKKPCMKQRVHAVIVKHGVVLSTGENSISTDATTCPRVERNCKTGEGYELCKSICNQGSHAEISAINNATTDLTGATLYLFGHTYACEPCKEACKAAGIVDIIIPPATIDFDEPATEPEKATSVYTVALQVGGIMEQPEITYINEQQIVARSPREAEAIYNKINKCEFYYGKCI